MVRENVLFWKDFYFMEHAWHQDFILASVGCMRTAQGEGSRIASRKWIVLLEGAFDITHSASSTTLVQYCAA